VCRSLREILLTAGSVPNHLDGPEEASVVVCCGFLKPQIWRQSKDDVDAPIAGVIFPLARV
jgi:hypothetical protein